MDEMKKKPRQFLTNDEKWAIYKFCIEHHCISQNGAGIKFRVTQTMAADEINAAKLLGRSITAYHVNTSVVDVIEWETRFNKFPEPQETMDMQQMKIQHVKDITEIERLKLVIENLQKQINKNENYEEINKRLLEKINKIKIILSS